MVGRINFVCRWRNIALKNRYSFVLLHIHYSIYLAYCRFDDVAVAVDTQTHTHTVIHGGCCRLEPPFDAVLNATNQWRASNITLVVFLLISFSFLLTYIYISTIEKHIYVFLYNIASSFISSIFLYISTIRCILCIWEREREEPCLLFACCVFVPARSQEIFALLYYKRARLSFVSCRVCVCKKEYIERRRECLCVCVCVWA